HAFNVNDRDDTAHDHRPLGEAILLKLLGLQRSVGRTEGHGGSLDLLDARARTDRLVVHAIARLLLVGISPLGEDGEDKGRTGTGDVGPNARGSPGYQTGGHGGVKEINADL